MFKIVILGAGNIAHIHADVYLMMKDIDVVAIIDTDIKKADILAEKLNSISLTEFNSNLLKDIDYVDICVPTYLHKDYIVKFANMKCNILCEKPLCINFQELKDIKKVVNSNGIKFMVGHCIRFNSSYICLKK